jgi:flagellin
VQASSGTYSDTDRAALNLEFDQLQSEMIRIAGNTQWNGFNILDGTAGGTSATVNYQVGAGSGQTMSAEFNTLYRSVTTATNANTVNTTDAAAAAAEKYTVALTDASTAVAGDFLHFTVTDRNSKSYDVVVKLSTSGAAKLSANTGGDYTISGNNHADLVHITGGITDLANALNDSGDDGYTIKFTAANTVVIEGTSNGALNATDEQFTVSSVAIKRGEIATLDGFSVSSASDASRTVAQLDSLITTVAAGRAKYGAYINRLEYASDNLMNVAQNTDASRSQIEDADYAAETSELARTQIIAQASTAMLAQANQSKQSVLALLQ